MQKNISTAVPISRDLDNLSRYMMVAYVLATLVLCSALIFSYFTLNRILIEQSSLTNFGATTNELRITIRDSTLILSDLKAAKELTQSESRLENKIKTKMQDTLEKIGNLRNQTSSQLAQLKGYKYYDDFNKMFNSTPHNIWLKLDDYLDRLNEISTDAGYGAPGSDLLWLPVEATAAKDGALGQSYGAALVNLQNIIRSRSSHLSNTHWRLTLLSLIVVALELVMIFLPLKRRLEKVNTNLLSAHKKLFLQANYDQETGLSNETGIAKILQSNNRPDQYGSLLIVGLENLENISKVVGPPALDIFFKEFVNQLSKIDSSDKLVFRAGDSEFGILQTNNNRNTNASYILNIQKTLEARLHVENTIVYPKIRMGYADGSITADNLLNKLIDARLAAQLYKHTEATIPQYQSYMRSHIEDENLLVERIRAGIENNEFIPYYQLKVDAKTGLACGMEALCRWSQSGNIKLSPGQFIPVAEKSGLITDVTWQMLEQIAKDHNTWVEAGLQPGRIAFNAAELFLSEVDFRPKITNLVNGINQSECPLDLEITENVALGRDSDVISNAISTARQLGMEIALDDFGTGYASLSSIVGLDVDIIKVDQSFVRMMMTNTDSKNIVLTIIYLCQQLKKKCVVEGVETKEEWEFCRDLGCDEIQGYYFHKPAPFKDVLDILSNEQLLKKAG